MTQRDGAARERRLEGWTLLISEMLDLAGAVKGAGNRRLELSALLGELAADAARAGPVLWQAPEAACKVVVGERALRRIVACPG